MLTRHFVGGFSYHLTTLGAASGLQSNIFMNYALALVWGAIVLPARSMCYVVQNVPLSKSDFLAFAGGKSQLLELKLSA